MAALGEDHSQLIDAVVKAALSKPAEKTDYSRPNMTHLQVTIESMIQEEAKKVFDLWLVENRKRVHDAILKRLNKSPQKFIDQIIESLMSGGSDSFTLNTKMEYIRSY